MKKITLLALVVVLLLSLTACRNETQNRIRRSIQDFTGRQFYITLYSLDGNAVYQGIVDGKVTRSSNSLSGTSDAASGYYIYWYDELGRYHQSDLPYLLTSHNRQENNAAPGTQ